MPTRKGVGTTQATHDRCRTQSDHTSVAQGETDPVLDLVSHQYTWSWSGSCCKNLVNLAMAKSENEGWSVLDIILEQ